MPAPEVSVVLPTHNRLPLLRRALRCALEQVEVDHEVIVVDDGSSDGTESHLAGAAAGDARLQVLRHEVGSGVARARNAGIAAARGTWIAFLDDDDVWSPRKLRAQLDAAAAAGATLVYGTSVAVDGELRPIRLAPAPDPDGLDRLVLRTNPIGGPSAFMARADSIRRVGGFDASFSPLADWDILIPLVLDGPNAACHEVVVGYVEHGENMMVSNASAATEELRRLAEKHALAAADRGLEFGDLWASTWRGRQLRRSGNRFRAAGEFVGRARKTRSAKDAARAVGALLGERATQRGRRVLGRGAPDPDWLRALR